MTKIAVPSETSNGLTSVRSGHFGHTPFFTMVTIEDGQIANVEVVQNVDHDIYGCGGVIDFALAQNIDVMIAVGMGVPPLTRFTKAGVKVYSERETPIVGDVVAKYLNGQCELMSMDEACDHH